MKMIFAWLYQKNWLALIKQEFPDIKIVETRPDKYIVDLHERADIANPNKGDLFISIHVNAMPPYPKKRISWIQNRSILHKEGKEKDKTYQESSAIRYYAVPNTSERGTQTYIWGAHKGEAKGSGCS